MSLALSCCLTLRVHKCTCGSLLLPLERSNHTTGVNLGQLLRANGGETHMLNFDLKRDDMRRDEEEIKQGSASRPVKVSLV